MPILLGPADYDAVRQAIEIGTSADDLPDQVIALDQYAGEAERQVLALAANLAPTFTVARGTDGWRQLETAAALLCASLIVGAIPQLTREQFADYRYVRLPIDPIALARSLRTRAVALVSTAVQLDIMMSMRPTVMILGTGGRGNTTPTRVPSSSLLGPF